MNNFQVKLLSTEEIRAEQCPGLFVKINPEKNILRKDVKKELLPSILYHLRKERRYHLDLIGRRLNDRLGNLSWK